MSGSRSRRKGHAFERRIANDLHAAGYDAKRCLTEVREGNQGDIEFRDGTPLTIQCKCYAKQVPWLAALREAEEAARPRNHYAVAVTKSNNAEPVAHMPWHDLLELLGLPDVRCALQGKRTIA